MQRPSLEWCITGKWLEEKRVRQTKKPSALKRATTNEQPI